MSQAMNIKSLIREIIKYRRVCFSGLCVPLFLLQAESAYPSSKKGHLPTKSQYVDQVVQSNFVQFQVEDPSISLSNNFSKEDESAITSFADSFLWVTGIRTKLSHGYDGKYVFIYISNFRYKEDIHFESDIVSNIYNSRFEELRSGGPCTKFILTNMSDNKKSTFVFLDKNSDFDIRISCIYRNFRSQFGIDESLQMKRFEDTFLMDLRLINCRKNHKDGEQFANLISSGKC